MTFSEIVQDVMDRLNLTSDEARTRIGNRVNDRYRRVTSSIGLLTSRRVESVITVDSTAPGSILPDVLIPGMEKVLRITFPEQHNSGSVIVLRKISYDDLRNLPTTTDGAPRAFAVKRMGAGQVTITLDSYTTSSFTLNVEGYEIADILSDDAEPVLSTDFHDILIAGAMADELMKMEKAPLAQAQEQRYESRLSDLRMFIAKCAWEDIVQGKDKSSQLWYRPWFSRISM